ncbi:MAG: Hsp20/alpha crystallin family protein [Candidatus Omnitrophica bacterium]|nr:Hsp20/alpha crystallin family protein [Candidatus Omnitrophota bacterium]
MSTIAKPENREEKTAGQDPSLTPTVDIFETKDGFILEADMPGVNKAGLEIMLDGNELTIIGRRNLAVPDASILYRESKVADFHRTFELAPAIDISRISAKMEQGVLTLNLPKSEEVKPRKIAVTD